MLITNTMVLQTAVTKLIHLSNISDPSIEWLRKISQSIGIKSILLIKKSA